MSWTAGMVTQARQAAESLMVDRCRITHQTGTTVDPNTGVETPTTVTVYEGRCRFQQRVGVGLSANVGQATQMLLRAEVHVPVSVAGVAERDVVVCLSSALDPDLPGRSWRVRELIHKSLLSARRLGVEEIT